jgi:uncharacterized Tic20 family protein
MTSNPQDRPNQGGQQPYSGQPTPPPPPPGYTQGYGQQGQAPISPSDARMWALFANLGGIFFSFIPSLVIYVIYKDRDPFIRRHASQALNFQIILGIVIFVSSLLTIILIGFIPLFAAFVCGILFPILGAVAANKGEQYDYPLIPQMVT